MNRNAFFSKQVNTTQHKGHHNQPSNRDILKSIHLRACFVINTQIVNLSIYPVVFMKDSGSYSTFVQGQTTDISHRVNAIR